MGDDQGWRVSVTYTDTDGTEGTHEDQAEAASQLRAAMGQQNVGSAAMVPESQRTKTRRQFEATKAALRAPRQLDWSVPVEAAEQLCSWDRVTAPQEWQSIEQRLDRVYDRTVLVLAMRMVDYLRSGIMLPSQCGAMILSGLRDESGESLMTMSVADQVRDQVEDLIRELGRQDSPALAQLRAHADSVVVRNAAAVERDPADESLEELMSSLPLEQRLRQLAPDRWGP